MDSLHTWALWLIRVMLASGVVFNLWYGCRKASAIRRRRAILARVRWRALPSVRPSDTPI